MNKKISSRTASNMPSLRELLLKEKPFLPLKRTISIDCALKPVLTFQLPLCLRVIAPFQNWHNF